MEEDILKENMETMKAGIISTEEIVEQLNEDELEGEVNG